MKKTNLPNRELHKRKNRSPKLVTHTFIGRYDGKDDWNTELAKLIAQFQLSLDHDCYSVSSEKIIFSVTGSRQSIEKLAATLNGLEGYVNIRARLAETKRSLRETMNARNARRERLNDLNKAPWYKRGTTRHLTREKAELGQAIAADGLKISTLKENLEALEKLLGAKEPNTAET